jgi:phage gpG-like protein
VSRSDPVRVEGAAQLRRTLKGASKDLQKQLAVTHRAVSGLVAAQARPAAPRRSGALAASLRPGGTQTKAVVRVGGAAVPYAGPIHWGWAARNIPAQPFVAQVVDSNEPQIVEAYLERVDDILGQVKGA